MRFDRKYGHLMTQRSESVVLVDCAKEPKSLERGTNWGKNRKIMVSQGKEKCYRNQSRVYP